MKQTISAELCAKCKGKGLCGQKCIILQKFDKSLPRKKTHLAGSSPPEIFVGRYNYPNVFTGVLSPVEFGSTEKYSLPELWFKNQSSIDDILGMRGKMVYGRFTSKISDARKQTKLLSVMQEVSLTHKSVSTEFFLEKPVKMRFNVEQNVPIIGNPAPVKNIKLQENSKIDRKVDYISSDSDLKAENAILELNKFKIETSNIIKILSAGMLGLKFRRKLVPTRWAVTAVDDTVSKNLLKEIRYFPEISEIMVFNSEYLGNHYEILLLPDKFSFEVIEAKLSGSVWNPNSQNDFFMVDSEGFRGRKNYASSVTGAYYANRLALCEYLVKIRRQASCLFLREARPEYYAPCGVGILREVSRDAFRKNPEKFSTLKEALEKIKSRLRLNISQFVEKSWLLKEHGKQTRLSQFL